MSKSIDERIVQMEFKNDKFEDGVKETIKSLKELKKESDFKGLKTGAESVDLSKISKEVDKVGVSFKALDVLKYKIFGRFWDGVLDNIEAGFKKIPNMFNNALNIIKTKGWNRAANLENAQFQLDGLKIAWESVSTQIDNAVSGTAYGLDSAAKAAAQLAASGVKIGEGFKWGKVVEADVDEMERALGAISGIAAMTNSTYDEIGDIFTDAAGRGRVSADTFNRIAQRGLNASAELAKSMGVTEEKVRDLASKGKISFQEFADAMYDAYYEQAKKSNQTFDGALSNMQFALGKIGAEFATPIRKGLIEPFNEVRMTINRVKTAMNNSGLFSYFSKVTAVMSDMFVKFTKGFRENDANFKWVYNLTNAFKNLCELLLRVLIPIKDAFKNAFGGSAVNILNSLTKSLFVFLAKITPSVDTMNTLRMGFEAFFTIIKNLLSIIGNFISAIAGIRIEGNSIIGLIGTLLAYSLKAISVLTTILSKLLNFKAVSTAINYAINFLSESFKTLAIILGGTLGVAVFGAYKGIKSLVDLFNSAMNSKSSNPLIILLQEIVSRAKQIPSIFPNVILKVKEFINSFNAADTASKKISLIVDTLAKFKNKIVDLFNTISNKVRQFGDKQNPLTYFISELSKGIGVLVQDLSKLGSAIGTGFVSLFTKASDSIKKLYSSFTTNLQNFNGNVLLAFWKTLSDAVKNFISGIPSAISQISKFFSELNIIDKIKAKFQDFIDFLSKLGVFLGNSFSSLGLVTVKAAELDNALTSVSGASDKSKWDTTGIQNFIEKIKEFVANINLGQIAVVSFLAVILSILVAVKKFIKSLTSATDSVSGLFGGIGKMGEKIAGSLAGSFGKIGDGIKRYFDTLASASKHKTTFDEVATSLLKFSGAIAILVGSLILLSNFMDGNNNIANAGIVLGSIAGGIIVFVGALALINHFGDLGFLMKFSVVILSFAASMYIFAKAMKAMPIFGIYDKAIVLGLLMGELALVAALLSKYAPQLVTGSLSLLTFALTLGVIAKALKYVPDLINYAGDMIVLAALLGIGAYVFDTAAQRFGEALKSFGMAMAGIGVAVLAIALALKVLEGIENISDGLFDLSMILGVLLGMSMVIVFFNKKMGSNELPKFSASMVFLAGAVGLLAMVVKYIGAIPKEQADKGMAVVNDLIIMLGLLMVASKFTEKAHPAKFAAGLVLITGCIAILTGLMALVGLIPEDIMNKGQGVVLGIIAMIAGLMAASSLTEKANTGSIIAALAGCGVILTMLLALTLTKEDQWPQVYKSLGIIAGVLISFGIMMALVGSGKYTKNGGKSLLAMIVVVAEIGIALYALAQMNWKQLAAAGGAMAGTLLAFGATMAIIGNIKGLRTERIKMFLMASLMFVPIGVALWALAQCDWQSIAAASIGMTATLLAFAGVMTIFQNIKPLSPAESGQLLLSTLVLVPIAAALFAVAKSGNWQEILTAMGAISVTLLALAAAFAIVNTIPINLGSILGFLAASLVLYPITKAIANLAQYDWQGLLAAAGSLSLVLLALGGAFALMSIGGWANIGSGLAIIGVALALNMLVPALMAMQAISWESLGKAGAVLGGLALAITVLGALGELAGIGAVILIAVAAALDLIALAMWGASQAFNVFVPALEKLAGLPLAEIASGLTPLSGALSLLGLAGVVLALGALGLAPAALYMSGLASGLMLMSQVGDISHIPGPLALIGAAGLVLGAAAPGMGLAASGMTLLAGGLILLGNAVNRAADLISNGIDTIVKAIQNGATVVKVGAEFIGTNLNAGLINGIKSGTTGVLKTVAGLGTSIISTAMTVLGVHSPSRILMWIGEMCNAGLDDGMNNAQAWSAIKSKLSNNLNNSILAPASNVVGKLKSLFSGLTGTTSNLADGWENKVPTSVKKAMESMNGAYKSGLSIDSLFSGISETFEEMIPNSDDLASSLDGLTDSLGGGSGGGAAGAAKEADDAFSKLSDTIAGQMDIFSEFSKSTELSSEKLLENMRSQIKGVTEWSNMMGVLAAKGVDEGLLAKLADMGPQGYEYVNAFVNMTGEQLQEANLLYQQSLILPKSAATSIINSFSQAADWCTKGLVQGTNLEEVNQNGMNMADAMLTGFEEEAGIHSPSVVMSQNGRWLMIGLKNGMEQTANLQTIPKAASIARAIINEFETNLKQETFNKMGRQAMIGLIEGLRTYMAEYNEIVTYISQKLSQIYKKENQIHSPSRLMRQLGGYSMEGLILGLLDHVDDLEDTSTKIANTTYDVLRSAMDGVSEALDSDLDLNPTIAPILDLDNIQNGASSIGNMLNDAIGSTQVSVNRARLSNDYNTNGYVGQTASQVNPESGGLTYIQNNYSPKALSRIDIYRQTEAQLLSARG